MRNIGVKSANSKLAHANSNEEKKTDYDIEDVTSKYDIKSQIYISNISDGRRVIVIEYHDSYDRDAGKVFEQIIKKLLHISEKLSIVSLPENLMTYPYVKQKLKNEELFVHGWYYDIETGHIDYYDPDTYQFSPLSEATESIRKEERLFSYQPQNKNRDDKK